MSLVSTSWLNENLNKVKIIDSSWTMPNVNRKAYEEYKKEHITNAIFFDIDKFSNKKTELPHMLPDENEWKKMFMDVGFETKTKHILDPTNKAKWRREYGTLFVIGKKL